MTKLNLLSLVATIAFTAVTGISVQLEANAVGPSSQKPLRQPRVQQPEYTNCRTTEERLDMGNGEFQLFCVTDCDVRDIYGRFHAHGYIRRVPGACATTASN